MAVEPCTIETSIVTSRIRTAKRTLVHGRGLTVSRRSVAGARSRSLAPRWPKKL